MKTNLHLFKNTIMLSLLLLAYTGAFSQTATAPTAGDGTEGNPYQIATLDNLAWLMQTSTVWDKYFVQTADIDATTTKTWGSGIGFSPIGNITTRFTGSYNGKENTISNLYINRSSVIYIGLFGRIDVNGKIDSLGLTNVDITGDQYTGGLAGVNVGSIKACYSTGKISGKDYLGGIVGTNYGIVNNCYSKVNITGTGSYIGGFVGFNKNSKAVISNCYSTGSVAGSGEVGGFVGRNYVASITKCYSTGTSNKEGFSGYNNATISSCFWDTQTSGKTSSKGGTGKTTAEMKNINTYLDAGWDYLNETINGTNDIWGINSTDNNGYPFLTWQGYTPDAIACQAPLSPAKNILFENVTINSIEVDSIEKAGYGTVGYAVYINSEDTWTAPVDGTTTPTVNTVWSATQQCIYFGTSTKPEINVTELSANTKYYFKVYAYNDCSGTETYETTGKLDSLFTNPAYSIPTGTGISSNPYQISNLEELTWLMYSDTAWNKHHIQTANIDAQTTKNWFDGKGFSPIGNATTKFTGSYNGKKNTISNLYINKPSTDYIGLFGYVGANGIVDSTGITNIYVNGSGNTGGLVGWNAGNVKACFSTGEVSSTGTCAGGLVGRNYSIIDNCYSEVNTSSTSEGVGGFVGYNSGSGTVISNCFSTGSASGSDHVGGFIGSNHGSASIIKCYSTGLSSEYGFAANNWGTITACFWDKVTSGKAGSHGGTGKTTAQMTNISTFLEANWDFINETTNGTDNNWGINSTDNNGYPFLSWQIYTPDEIPCQAPLSPAKNIYFGNTTSSTIQLDSIEKAGYGTIGYAVYINSEDTWTAPVDGTTTPTVNTVWTTGPQCIYFGTSTKPEINVTGLSINTKYYFKAYAYNDCSGTKTYETTAKLDSIYTETTNSIPSGVGTSENPYLISNLEELAWLSYSDTAWNKHFIQTADIDAQTTKNWFDGKGFLPIGNITTQFTGSYNGKKNTISNLYINTSVIYTGLFGRIDVNGKIDSLGLTNVDITGYQYTGGLAGVNVGSIKACYSTGKISGKDYLGGIVGTNYGIVNNCYSKVNITGTGSYIGGFVGFNKNSKAVISNCYSTGGVTGSGEVGGFVGRNYKATISSCFWDKETSGQTGSAGGTSLSTPEMKNIRNYLKAGWDYAKETLNGSDDIWGINSTDNNGYPFLTWQGYTPEAIPCQTPFFAANKIICKNILHNSIQVDSIGTSAEETSGYVIYINSADSWTAPVDGTTPTANTVWTTGPQCIYLGTSTKPEINVTGLSANTKYYFKVYAYNDCSGSKLYEQTGKLDSVSTKFTCSIPYGTGTSADPYKISNLDELAWLMQTSTVWDKYFVQTADIDARFTKNWNESTGIIPIGNDINNFTGTYNGKGHVIDSLYINQPSTDYVGLFGYIGANAQIDSLGVTDIDFIANNNTGGLVGWNEGSINTCFSTGKISSKGNWTGGFTGRNYSIIDNCYSEVNTSSTSTIVGGFAGYNSGSGTVISNCYSTGSASGSDHAGGFVGSNHNTASIIKCYSTGQSSKYGFTATNWGTITACFWDNQTSGKTSSQGGTGKPTAQMNDITTYLDAGWDFKCETGNGNSDIWGIEAGFNQGYPYLVWQKPAAKPVPVSNNLSIITGECSADISEAPSAIDDCGNTILATTNSSLPFTITETSTIVWTYTDALGNSEIQTQEVIISDTKAPVITSTHSDQTIDAATNCESALPDYTANVVVTDNCTQNAGLSITQSPIAGKMLSGATNQVTITVTDEAGNNVSTSFNVAVADNTAPVPNATILSDLSGECSIVVSTSPTADDNCSSIITGTSTHGTTPFTVTETSTIVWTYTDGAGNTATQNQKVTIADTEAPVPNATLSDLSEECSVVITTAPTANDNCSSTITGTSTYGTTPFTITETSTIVWTYTDGAGNTATQEQIVTITDNTKPVITSTHSDQTIDAAANCESALPDYTANITATDNCTQNAGFSITQSPIAGTMLSGATNPVILTVTDNAGNNVSVNFNVVVIDNIDPVITSTHNDQTIDAAANCEAALPDYTANVVATDNCTQNAGLSITQSPIAGKMLSGATNQVTLTVTDEAGNNVSASFNVAVADNTAPVPNATTLSDLSGECSVSVTTTPTANDNCSSTITGTSTHGTAPFTVYETSTIVWTYTDGAGNIATQNQEVTIADTKAPVPNATTLSDLSEECSVVITTAPTAGDNCSSTITGSSTYGTTPFTIYETSTIVWTYTDESGNTATQNQEVTIADTEAPVPNATLSDLSEECSVVITTAPTADDNCSSTITGTSTHGTTPFTIYETSTIVWTYTDGAGNTATQNQEVTIADTEVPVISCIENQTKEIASNETIYTVSGTEFDPVSNSDNCTVESIVNNFNNTETLNAAVFPTGTTTVTWTVADAAGNTANCSFDIAVSISNDIYELEKMGISIYPNPVSNILNINIGDGNIQRITITNILGKTVLNKLKTNKNERIDMSGFSSGIYIISIYKEQQVINHRIIKQ